MPELGAGVPSSLGRHAVPLGPFSVAHIFDRDHDRHGTTLRARRFASDDDARFGDKRAVDITTGFFSWCGSGGLEPPDVATASPR